MRFRRVIAGLVVLLHAGCGNSAYQMPRGPLVGPEPVPEVELTPGLEHRVQRAGRNADPSLPLAVADDPDIVEFENDPETGDLFAIGLKPGRTLIRYPAEGEGMATKIRVKPPEPEFPDRRDIPRYLQGEVNPATFARAVNRYLRMGESRACRHLIEVSELGEARSDQLGNLALDRRISHVARVLFRGNGRKPLRAAYLGGTMLPYQSMPDGVWPLLPMAEQDGVHFDLGGPMIIIAGGLPEPIPDYLRYCRKEGAFRRVPLEVPSRRESIAAAEALMASERWRAVREQAKLRDESFSEGWIRESILFQARSIY